MTFAWLFQIGVDIGFAVFVFFWWRERGRQLSSSSTAESIPVTQPDLTEKIQLIDEQMDEYRKRMNGQLLALAEICKEAKNILDRGQLRMTAFSPSEEEREIRDRASAQIPTLQEVEKSRQRLKSDVIVDLKTLLKDQLA